MDKPTDEQIKKFWEWCGCRFSVFPAFYDSDIKIIDIIFPDGEERRYSDKYGLGESIDLNNLFKYAVPKLREEYSDLKISIMCFDGKIGCSISRYGKLTSRKKNFQWNQISGKFGETPELALFWAIREVING